MAFTLRPRFSDKDPDNFPWTLRLLVAPSFLCAPSNPCFLDLRHETSDELAERLVSTGVGLRWHLRLLETAETTDRDLLSLVVTGWSGEDVDLSTGPSKVKVPDAVLAWQRMPRQAPSSSRRRGTEGPTEASAAIAGVISHDMLPSAEGHDDADEVDDTAFVGVGGAFDGALGDDVFDDILGDLELELMGGKKDAPQQSGEDVSGEEGPDEGEAYASLQQEHADALERVLASDEPAGSSGVVSGPSAPEEIAPDSPPRAASSTSATQNAPMAPPSGAAASSSASDTHALEAGALVEQPSCTVSEQGYVADEHGKSMGRITYFGKNISCRCTLHKDCTNVKTIKRATKESMLAWLAAGRRVPWDAPESEKVAARSEHQLAKLRAT